MDITPAPLSSSVDCIGESPPLLTTVPGHPLTGGGRVLLAACGLILASGFALAATLEPDPRGFGTHQRLGFPPCTVRVWFGVCCPSCGSTTSFAHFVRGQWVRAAESNAAAFGLAGLCAAAVPWSLYSAMIGRCWRVPRPGTVLVWVLAALCVVSSGQWGWRLWRDIVR